MPRLRQMFRCVLGGLAMTATELATRYRGYAAKCLLIAQTLETASDKLVMVDMAQAWADLATILEKNEHLVLVFEAPTINPQ